MIRVLLVNEFELMGNIITEVLEDEPDIAVIGCVTTPQDALVKISNEDVDMVLVSTHLPNDGALRKERESFTVCRGRCLGLCPQR